MAKRVKKIHQLKQKTINRKLLRKNAKSSKRNKSKLPIEITNRVNIQFDQSQNNQLCSVLIRNKSDVPIKLDSVNISLPTVKRYNHSIGQSTMIQPYENLEIFLEATFVPNKLSDMTKVGFNFGGLVTIWCTIKIRYQAKGPVIRRELYDVPEMLNTLIVSEHWHSQSNLNNALNKWIPSIDIDYAKHFHNLYYLEEIGLRKRIKAIYNQDEAYFGGTETKNENGRIIRNKYEHGVYDVEVKDLCETRPSLKIGDKIIARKHSSLHIPYEGVAVKIKESDLICVRFNDDFVYTFDHTAYMIDFDFTRSLWIRMHFAIDLALGIFGTDYLMPKEFIRRNTPIVEVHLNQHHQLEMANGQVLNWFIDHLNWYQKEAVANVLMGDLLFPYLIYGPPGTGKTTTLTEIILQILTNIANSKILITTQSNSAANLIVQRLIQFKHVNPNNLLRLIGFNYAQKDGALPDDIEDYACTVDNLLPVSGSTIHERLSSVKRFRMVVGTSTTIAQMLEVRELRNHFTHAIVDEAGQSTEMEVLVPMALVGKNGQTILAGDPMQMSPLVMNFHANQRGLNISMLSRLLDCYTNIVHSSNDIRSGSHLISKLFLNYRSLPSIMEFYNTQFYNSKLIPMIDGESSFEANRLNDISEGIFGRSNNYGIYFMNVNGENLKRSYSHWNPYEICVIQYLVESLKHVGCNNDDIGIITPYALQQRLIEKNLDEDIKVGTIEDFQGLERHIILISTVRTSSNGVQNDSSKNLGFVKCPKRINVAISRARAVVIVIGEADLLSTDDNWNVLIDKCKTNRTFGEASVDKCTGVGNRTRVRIDMENSDRLDQTL